jgi:hypothetical protein
VGGEALVEARDLLAKVLALELEERLRVLALDRGHEERQEASDEVGDAAEHAAPPGRAGPAPNRAYRNVPQG